MSEKQEISELIKDCEKAAKKKLTNFQGIQIIVEGDLESASELIGNSEAEKIIREPLEKLRDVMRQLPSLFHRKRLRDDIQKVLDVEYKLRKAIEQVRKSIGKLTEEDS